MAITSWIPRLIKQTLAESTGDVVTAVRWNELFNLTIGQGDYSAAQIKVLSDTLDGKNFLTAEEVTRLNTVVNYNDAPLVARVVAVESVAHSHPTSTPGIFVIEDNIVSESATSGLAARQGKVLSAMITAVSAAITQVASDLTAAVSTLQTAALLKQDKGLVTIDAASTTIVQLLVDNTEYLYGTLTALTLTAPAGVFNSFVSFSCPTTGTATVITVPAGTKFFGTDCTAGAFTPVINKRYSFGIWFDNSRVNITVGGA